MVVCCCKHPRLEAGKHSFQSDVCCCRLLINNAGTKRSIIKRLSFKAGRSTSEFLLLKTTVLDNLRNTFPHAFTHSFKLLGTPLRAERLRTMRHKRGNISRGLSGI